MRFLDLDLDFFLNDNAYLSGSESERQGPEYKPWSPSKVRHFLEERCGLSHHTLVPGRTVETHDGIIPFWHTLIESGGLKVPFEVTHIDAHPDIAVWGGLYQSRGFLHIEPERSLAMFEREHVHSGNYLTFAISCGWIASLVWIPLLKTLKDLPKSYRDGRYELVQLKERKDGDSHLEDSSMTGRKLGVPFKILPWNKFRTDKTFDYMVLSRSPNFTPPKSDLLIPIIEGYMRKI